MEQVDVAIVGGGPAGLSTAGALKKVGFTPVVFDRNAAIGDSWMQRYDRLHLHTVRAFSGLAHLPIPSTYPKYLSRAMYAQYLQAYRDALALRVVQGCTVESIEPVAPAGGGAQFILRTTSGPVYARAVVVASGMFAVPVRPRFTDLDAYRGDVLHSSEYRSGERFGGKRVLVVGIGNTGAEIAADLVEQGAKYVAVSVRSAPTVVPRDVLGIPVQFFGIVLSSLPPRVADAVARALSRIVLGDLRRYGLPPAQWSPFSSKRIPVIDVGFVKNLQAGNITVRPMVESFAASGVRYVGGVEEEVDAVVLATGFRPALDGLIAMPQLRVGRELPEFGCGERTPVPGLYFMGFIESHRGLLFEIDIRSRQLARMLLHDAAAMASTNIRP